MKNVLTAIFLLLLLTSCTNKVVIKSERIPPCQTFDDLEQNATWLDLVEKYLEVRDLYIICSKKVEVHNGKLEK